MRKLLFLFFVCLLALSLASCSQSVNNTINYAADKIQPDDVHVLMVKGGKPEKYPDITFGEAFDNFFGTPSWKYFQGTQDDSEEVFDVVEFSGTCLYQDVPVTAKLQFVLSDNQDTFEASYLSFNDVPQNRIIMTGLLTKVFEEYQNEQELKKRIETSGNKVGTS